MEKPLHNENYKVCKNINKSQIFKRIRLRKFTTDLPLEGIYTNGNIRPEDVIVSPQDHLYSIGCESESHPSLLDHPKKYCDPVSLAHTGSRDAFYQQNDDTHFPRKQNIVSDSIAEAP